MKDGATLKQYFMALYDLLRFYHQETKVEYEKDDFINNIVSNWWRKKSPEMDYYENFLCASIPWISNSNGSSFTHSQ